MSRARSIVITGAAGGIGSEIVHRFLPNGDTVVAADLSPDTLDTWRTRWDSVHPHPALHALAVDIASEESVTALVETVRNSLGAVDVLIDCAGYFPQTTFEDMTSQEWRRVIDINLTGDVHTIKAFLPLLKASDRARIVNIGSGSVFQGETPKTSSALSSSSPPTTPPPTAPPSSSPAKR